MTHQDVICGLMGYYITIIYTPDMVLDPGVIKVMIIVDRSWDLQGAVLTKLVEKEIIMKNMRKYLK